MSMFVVNLKGMKLSTYTGITLLGVGVLDDRLYGVNTAGLVEMTGDDDEGADIDAYVKTGKMRFGSTKLKRSSRLYLDGAASNGLDITITTKESGVDKARQVKVKPFLGTARKRVAKLSRKAESVYWQVKIANVDGGTFELKNPEMLVTTLNRQV